MRKRVRSRRNMLQRLLHEQAGRRQQLRVLRQRLCTRPDVPQRRVRVAGDPTNRLVYKSMMRVGIFLDYSGGFLEAANHIVELEKVGVDIALGAEAYSYDAVSQLGYLAAKTERIERVSGVFPIYIRTPSLLAMTAAGLDFVS